ncbi:MAG: glycosyltransferase family 39 protein [Pseudomonadota bacterium]
MARLTGLLAALWSGLTGPLIGVVVLVLVALCTVLPGLETLPVTDRDEARFAQATKQMMETGDLVDIRFQDQPRWKKPAGIYWLQVASASALGGTEAPIWAYRLPSAIAGFLGAIMMVWAARPFVSSGRAAVISGLILASSILFVVEANIAKTDAALMLTAILTLGALGRLLLPDQTGGPVTALTLWVALAAAILLKGPIVPVIAILAAIGFWLLGRERPSLGRLRIKWGLPLMLALASPWLIAIWIVTDGGFFQESVGKDLLGKVAEGKEKHWGPPGLYSMIVWGTFWPWAAFLPLALPWFWGQRRTLWLVLLIAWTVPFWIILEAVPTKLPHYVLPLYPAIAIALAAWLVDGPEKTARRWQWWLSAILIGLPGIVLPLAAIFGPIVIERSVNLSAVLFAFPALAFGALAVASALRENRAAQALSGLIAALLIYPAVLHHGLPSLKTGFASPRIAEVAAGWRSCAEGPLVSAGYREPSLIFLTETGTLGASPEQTAQLMRDGAHRLFMVEDRWWPLIDPLLPDGRPGLVERGEIRYFNYNRGDYEIARFWTTDDPRWQPCE